MSIDLPLPQDKKLTVIFRLEPGCLGPDGSDHIEAFCGVAQRQIATMDADFVHWVLIPRFDKSLAEMQYKVSDKNLSHEQAVKYLSMFDKELDEFEEHLHDRVAHMIDEYLESR